VADKECTDAEKTRTNKFYLCNIVVGAARPAAVLVGWEALPPRLPHPTLSPPPPALTPFVVPGLSGHGTYMWTSATT
jgi:hypothetical protein